MTYKLLTTTLIACALAACGEKAPVKKTTPSTPAVTETSTPVETPPVIETGLTPGQFITGRRGVRAAKSDAITIADDAVTLRINPKGPSLGLSETFPIVADQDYIVRVDLDADDNVVGNLGFRMVAWSLDSKGAPLSQTGYTAIGRSFDTAKGRQTLTYRFGPATGETEASERLPNIGGESVRFLLEPVTTSTGATVRVYSMTVTQD